MAAAWSFVNIKKFPKGIAARSGCGSVGLRLGFRSIRRILRVAAQSGDDLGGGAVARNPYLQKGDERERRHRVTKGR